MVTMIPARFRTPVAVAAGLLGVLVLFSSYTRWQDGPFYGWSFNALRALVGLAILWVALHVARHRDA